MISAVDRFRSVLEPWKPSFVREYVSWLILRDRGGKNHLIYMQRFFTYLANTPENFEISTANLWAGRKVIQHDDGLDSNFIDRLIVEPSSFENWQQFTPEFPRECYAHFEPISPLRLRGSLRVPSLSFKRQFDMTPDFPDAWEIDHQLITAELPFANLADLLSALNVGLQSEEARYGQQIDLIVTPPARFFPQTVLSADRLEMGVEAAASIEPAKLSIAARIERRGQPFLRAKFFEAHACNKTPQTNSLTYLETLTDSISVMLFLVYDGTLCETIVVRDFSRSQNLRLSLHTLIDRNNTLLTSVSSSNGRDFESAVAVLLGIFGLSVLPYGAIKAYEERAPDLVAISADGYLFLIECTVGDIDNKGKLFKFSARCEEIKSAIKSSGIIFNGFQPVLITNLSRSNTSVHHDKLSNFGIALIARENIEQIVLAADASRPGKELYEIAVNLIPVSPRGEEFSAQIPLALQ